MSLGLPGHLAPQSITRAIGRAAHTLGFVVLAAACASVIGLQIYDHDLILWPALIALLPMLALLLVMQRRREPVYAVAYLAIGAACTYWYSVTVLVQSDSVESTATFMTALPKVALMMVGGPGATAVASFAWAAIGLALGEAATLLAALEAGAAVELDPVTLVMAAVLLVVLVGSARMRRRARHSQPSLHRAERDEQLAELRARIELRAATLVHDTVLNHLAAIGGATPGPISDELRRQVARDLESLVGEEWFVEPAAVDPSAARGWSESPLATVVAEQRAAGLRIEVTGELEAVSRLPAERAEAVALAVAQCLVNTRLHAGVDRAELAVYASDSELSVMVVDSGRGFSVEAVPADRMGLRHSIRRRVADVGGTAQIWSTPGRGTSVMVRVPLAPDERSAQRAGVGSGG